MSRDADVNAAVSCPVGPEWVQRMLLRRPLPPRRPPRRDLYMMSTRSSLAQRQEGSGLERDRRDVTPRCREALTMDLEEH